MKHFRIAILLITTSMLLCGCPKEVGHRYITIVNQSDNDVVGLLRKIKAGETKEEYDCQYELGRNIQSNSSDTFECPLRVKDWETTLNNHYLQIMVMDRETYDRYMAEPCDTIRKYVPVLHCYRLTLEDFQRMNWTVVYPPKE